MEGTIIIADDDKSIRTVLGQALTRAGCRVKLTGTISTLWKWVEDGEGDVLVVDVMMPDGDTLDIIPVLRRKRSDTPVIVMSAVNTVSTAVRAIESGAFEYLPKPFNLSKLISTVNLALKSRKSSKKSITTELNSDWNSVDIGDQSPKIIGSSEIMQKLYKSVAKTISLNNHILINGLSGTGKSLLARYIHDISSRRNRLFKEVKLVSLSQSEVELIIDDITSEILNDPTKIGTLFFDEVSHLDLDSQKKVLRLFEFMDLNAKGSDGSSTTPLVISSTSESLDEQINLGNFREDLYFRLNGISLNLPKLSKRSGDIEELVNYFLENAKLSENKFTSRAIKLLEKQDWRGNVRELKNFVLNTTRLSPNIEITEQFVSQNLEEKPDWLVEDESQQDLEKGLQLSTSIAFHLRKYFRNHEGGLPAPGLYDRLLKELEIPLINIALAATKGNQIKASKLLGLNRNTLRKKIRQLNIQFNKSEKF